MARTWGIKLGSGGQYAQFCRSQNPPIVGIGWGNLDQQKLLCASDWSSFRNIVKKAYVDAAWGHNERSIGIGAGQLWRFLRTTDVGDLVWYYDPTTTLAYVNRIASGPKFRSAVHEDKNLDIWHYRDVEARPGIRPMGGMLDGRIWASLRYPKMTFWLMPDKVQTLSQLVWEGRIDEKIASENEDIRNKRNELIRALAERLKSLNDREWEVAVAVYLEGQGAEIDWKRLGGTRPVADITATVAPGSIFEDVWQVQVKRYAVGWEEIRNFQVAAQQRFGDDVQIGFAAFEFERNADQKASSEGILLIDINDVADHALRIPEAFNAQEGLSKLKLRIA